MNENIYADKRKICGIEFGERSSFYLGEKQIVEGVWRKITEIRTYQESGEMSFVNWAEILCDDVIIARCDLKGATIYYEVESPDDEEDYPF